MTKRRDGLALHSRLWLATACACRVPGTLAVALALGGCPGSDAPTAVPAAPRAARSTAVRPATALAPPSSASGAAAAGASAAAAEDERAPVPTAPLPSCPVRAARAPVGFADAATTSGILFTTIDGATAHSLQRAQILVDGFWSGQSFCHVSRSDGELLVVFCGSWYLNGNGNGRNGPSESFVFHRYGDDWTRITLPVSLPGEGKDPRMALARECGERVRELPLDPPSDGYAWLNAVEPWPDGLHVEIGSRYEMGGSWACGVPWARLGRALGCGPFAHLLRPELLDPTTSSGREPGPLGFSRVEEDADRDMHRPMFFTSDPRRHAVATAVDAAIQTFYDRRPKDDAAKCDVTSSSASFVSVLCRAGQADPFIRDIPPDMAGITYRLADGARITSEDLFTSRPAALVRVAKKCLGGMVGVPVESYQAYVPKLPKLAPADVAFGLAANDVRFVVRHEAYFSSVPDPVVALSACKLGYGELGFSPRALETAPQKP